jgi:molybdopterin converting factor small subunit
MATVLLPSPLAARAGGVSSFALSGGTAGEVLRRLEREVPALAGWILDERGALREHVHVFVNEERAALDQAVGDGDEVYVLQAISGGSAAA